MSTKAKKLLKQEKEKKTDNRNRMICYLVIVAASFLLYANTIPNDYALDDKAIITKNKFTEKGFSGICDHLTTSYWEGIGKTGKSYRPVPTVLFAIETGLWGFNPHASHFFNILLYALTGLILFRVLRKLFRHYPGGKGLLLPLLGTLLFMAHPLHTEVVANLKSRDSMLELLFLFISLDYLLSYVTTGKLKDLVVSVSLFFPALLSKESAISYLVMVPVILLLYDRNSLWHKIKTTSLYFIPAALFLFLFYLVAGGIEEPRMILLDNMFIADEPYSRILATKFLILGKYIGLLFYPHPLVFDYSYNHIPMTGFSDPAAILSLLIYLFLFTGLVIVLMRKLLNFRVSPLLTLVAFSVAWFLMGLIVTSNLFFLIGSTMAERLIYISSLGFIILLLLGINAISGIGSKHKEKKKANIVLLLVCGVIFIIWTAITIDRNRAWKDDFTLFSTDLEHLPNSVKANDLLADIYAVKGDLANDHAQKRNFYLKSIELKEKAVSIYPDVPQIQQKLGYLYGDIGWYDKAAEKYSLSIQMNPKEVYNYVQIAKAYSMLGESEKSIPYLEKGRKLFPGHPELLHIAGIAYAQTGNVDEAIICFQKGLETDPENRELKQVLEYTMTQTGGEQ